MSLVLQDKLVLSPETAEHLQEEIDLLQAASDCADVVGTHAELEAYDTSTLTDQAIIKVLQDETENDAQAYWRWDASTQTWSLIGTLGPYVNTTTQHDKVYGTDENGNSKLYDANSFGQVDDVQVKTEPSGSYNSIVDENKIAKLDLSNVGAATIVDSTDTVYSITLEDNTIYNNTSAGVTTLTVTEPSGTIDSNFCSEIVFTSGSTATTVTPNANIMWIGDNVSETQGFVPRANCRYLIMFTYDGINLHGVIQGVSIS